MVRHQRDNIEGMTYLGIPHRYTRNGLVVFDILQENRERPRPVEHDGEELPDNDSTSRLRVELAYSGDQHSPSHTTRITHNIGIYSPSLSPELDGAKCKLECFLFRDQRKDLIGYACSIERAHLVFGQAAQEVVVVQVPLFVVGKLTKALNRTEDKIDADARVLKLDDGNESLGYRGQVGNSARGSHFLEKLGEDVEVLLYSDVLGYDDEGIDIGSRPIHTQAKAAIGENSASSITNEDGVVRLTFLGGPLHKLVSDALEVCEHRPSLLSFGLTFERALRAQLFEKGVGLSFLGIGRQRGRDRRRYPQAMFGVRHGGTKRGGTRKLAGCASGSIEDEIGRAGLIDDAVRDERI